MREFVFCFLFILQNCCHIFSIVFGIFLCCGLFEFIYICSSFGRKLLLSLFIIIIHQLSFINYHLSITIYQLLFINYHLSITIHQLPFINYHSSITIYQLLFIITIISFPNLYRRLPGLIICNFFSLLDEFQVQTQELKNHLY